MNIKERFDAKYELSNEHFWDRDVMASYGIIKCDHSPCWIWNAAIDKHPEHNYTSSRPKIGYKGRVVLAYRLAFEIYRHPIPEGMQIDHMCKHPSCVNPWHLQEVSAEEDAYRRRGEKRQYHHKRKFEEDEIETMMELRKSGVSMYRIAITLGRNICSISQKLKQLENTSPQEQSPVLETSLLAA